MARHSRLLAISLLALLVASPLTLRVAVACSLDGKPSLAVNGIRARRNPVAPTGGEVWAPFILDRAFTSGSVVRATELRASLVRTLSASMLAAPFRWNLGDGTIALGHTVAHRYARPGLYQIAVYALDPRAHLWFPFDKALLRIVAPGQLSHFPVAVTLDVHAGISSWPFWAIGGALFVTVLAPAARLVHRRRRYAASQRRPAHGARR